MIEFSDGILKLNNNNVSMSIQKNRYRTKAY